jgi:hypothetical protein
MLAVVATAFSGLIVPTPTVQQIVVPAAPIAQPSQALLFPTTDMLAGQITSIDDELEKAAELQRAQDAKIDAQV